MKTFVWVVIMGAFPLVGFSQPLYHHEQVTIAYHSQPRVRNHMVVSLNRQVKHISEVTLQEHIVLHQAVNKVMRIVREELGLPGGVIVEWERPRGGDGVYTIEIIPTREEKKRGHSLQDVLERNAYMMLPGAYKDKNPLPSPTAEQKAEDVAFWQERLQGELLPLPEGFEVNERRAWTQVQLDRKAAATLLYDRYVNAWEQAPDSNLMQLLEGYQAEDEKAFEKSDGCPFCIEKVIQQQTIWEEGSCYLFYNHKPAVPELGFLILPKRHIRTCDKLNEAEVRDMYQLVGRITQVATAIFGECHFTGYIQDAWQSGQTVPHVHLQWVARPDPKAYVHYCATYDDPVLGAPLTRDKVEATIKKLQETWQQIKVPCEAETPAA